MVYSAGRQAGGRQLGWIHKSESRWETGVFCTSSSGPGGIRRWGVLPPPNRKVWLGQRSWNLSITLYGNNLEFGARIVSFMVRQGDGSFSGEKGALSQSRPLDRCYRLDSGRFLLEIFEVANSCDSSGSTSSNWIEAASAGSLESSIGR